MSELDDEDDTTEECSVCGTTIDNPTGELPPDGWYGLEVEYGAGLGVGEVDSTMVCSIACAKRYLDDTWGKEEAKKKPS